jgi:hypothetical protein
MTLTQKRLLIGLFACVGAGVTAIVAFIALVAYVFSADSRYPLDEQSAMRCTLEWGRLQPFPPSAQQITITRQGNAFTRGFRASFTAPTADIERWLDESSGTRAVVPTTPTGGVRHFEITPGRGAQHAEVNVDDARHCVSIYVDWS